MVSKIYELKNKILKSVEETVNERGVDRMDVDRVGKMVDMVHHLAEAESNCWQAEYYRTVTEAMKKQEPQGYSGYGSMDGRSGYGGQPTMDGQSGRSGYGSMGHDDIIDKLGEEYRKMSPDDRMKMKSQVLTTLGSM